MHAISLHDKAAIRALLGRSPELHAYGLGDLDDFFWPYTSWYTLREERERQPVALIYSGGDLPVLLAIDEQPAAALADLLRAMLPLLPRRVYAHLSADAATGSASALMGVLGEVYRIESHGVYYKMALRDRSRLDAVDTAGVARMSPADLERWVKDDAAARAFCGYIAMLASEGAHAVTQAEAWLGAKDEAARVTGWRLLGQLAQRDESLPDAWFEKRLAELERTLHAAPNAERAAMNQAVILIGCRSAALRKVAVAAAQRIGAVAVDHGDTACKTPDAESHIEKAWTHSTAKGYETPAAHERSREPLRLRC